VTFFHPLGYRLFFILLQINQLVVNSVANKLLFLAWVYHRVWIVRLPIALVDFSRVDLTFVNRYF